MPANTSHILPAIPNGTTGQALIDAVNDRLRRIGLTQLLVVPPVVTPPIAPVTPPGSSSGGEFQLENLV